jgi:hypothetical protein
MIPKTGGRSNVAISSTAKRCGLTGKVTVIVDWRTRRRVIGNTLCGVRRRTRVPETGLRRRGRCAKNAAEAFIEELVDTRINCHLKHMGTSVQNFKAERSFSDPSRILSFNGFVHFTQRFSKPSRSP